MKTGTAVALVLAEMVVLGNANAFDLPRPGPQVLRRQRKMTPAMQAYVNALIDALDRYQEEIDAHSNDPRASRWLPWSARGYRLRAEGIGSMYLLVLHPNGPAVARFAIGYDSAALSCVGAMAERRLFSFGGHSAIFKSECIDGTIAFTPVRTSDEVGFRQHIEGGGRLLVTSVDPSGAFDLSGVTVLRAKLDAEALGMPPDE
ncbi:hypothetical protein [Luteibacter sp. SG786]|uniref:hypothetical protein n=1 Tax=Luteibacter sp. SG786 TaxID=2587130 RepID=UPI00141F0AC4|nr:hypothetical protein [Luteibacter sp. SG786]NII52785.1 hypothetical protein [Luteibacter sp. SG786]